MHLQSEADDLRAISAKSRVKSQHPSYDCPWIPFDVITIFEGKKSRVVLAVYGRGLCMLTCHVDEPLQRGCSDRCDQFKCCSMIERFGLFNY